MNETLEILSKVDTFYNSAWTKLMMFLGIVSFIVGILLPIAIHFIIQWYQKRQLRIEKNEIENELIKEFDKKQEVLEQKLINKIQEELNKKEKELQNKITIKVKELDIKTEKSLAKISGGAFLIQGNHNSSIKEYNKSIISYCNAITDFIKAKDYSNLQSAIGNLNNDLIIITKKELEIEKSNINKYIKIIIKALKEDNINGIHSNQIKTINKNYEETIKRTEKE